MSYISINEFIVKDLYNFIVKDLYNFIVKDLYRQLTYIIL